ncbi:MAG: CHASE3 domain-containing protein [Sphingomonadales bacterium]|nr:CHASE3 domain-containing protein [Sphingomonadales bacterium]MBD3772999.1 CHASE3 domain-containing protein [Paracoccaceae bacterium]
MRSWAYFGIFAAILLAMLGGIYLVYSNIQAERDLRAQVAKTNMVLTELRNVSQAGLNAETGQRGYLITLDPRYLAPYRQGRDQVKPAIARLRKLLGDTATAEQARLLDRMDSAADAKLAELDATVALTQRGEVLEARSRVLSDDGLNAMLALRGAIREMEAIERVILNRAIDRTAAIEARVIPLLAILAVGLMVAIAFAVRLVTHAARAEAEAAQAAALAEARDRADLLAKELNHRVKNLFAVVLAIVRLSARNAPEAKAVTESIAQRIHALLTAHEVTQGQIGRPAALLSELVETTLAPYRSEAMRAAIDGPDIMVPAALVTPLGLVLHELATNAVKYGAWSADGTVAVDWQLAEQTVSIAWRESGGPAPAEQVSEPSGRQGFGTMMMTSAARQLRGDIARRMGETGLEVDISFPLDQAQ